MSRNNKRNRKEKQQKQRRKEAARRRNTSPRWLDVCDQAVALMQRRKWPEARILLEESEQVDPGRGDVLHLLLDVYYEQRDFGPYCEICRRLVALEPDTPELHLMLANGYMADSRLVSALGTFRQFLERWPDDPLADGARESVKQLQTTVDELLQEMPFPANERIECAAIHEEILGSISASDWEQAIRIGEQLLTRCPNFVPAMNNVGEAYFRLGRFESAIAMSRRALRVQPENVHALGNLTRYLWLSGQADEARKMAERLRSAPVEREDEWYKKCEPFGFLGDDEAVLAIFADAVRAGAEKRQTLACALLHHVAAVAFARRGDRRQANRCWRQALKINPHLGRTNDNLADAAKPPGERHGPWGFPVSDWIPGHSIADLRDWCDDATSGTRSEAAERAMQRFAETHPEIVALVPALLDRGDEAARGLAWRLAFLLETPELLEALREFCLSVRGPDSMRLETANLLRRKGTLPSGSVRMWLEGEWREIEPVSFEITTEPIAKPHCRQVDDWLHAGCEALRHGKAVEAEGYFRKCIDLEGDAPDLLNNLAAAYDHQGRRDESRRMAHEIHERWPDYLFGRIALANIAMDAGDYEQVENLLAPLHRRERFHITEFAGLAGVNVRLSLAKGNVDAARRWLDMWREVDPDHPELPRLDFRCLAAAAPRRLRNLFFGRRR